MIPARRLLLACLLGALLLPAAHAEEPLPEEATVPAVEAAHAADDGAAMEALAKKHEARRWHVLFELVLRGKHGPATGWAEAGHRDRDAMMGYASARAGAPANEEGRKRLAAASSALDARDPSGVLRALKDAPDYEDPLLRARLGYFRGVAYMLQRDFNRAEASLEQAMGDAERAGWAELQQAVLNQAGTTAYWTSDWDSARRLWEKLLAHYEREENAAGVMNTLRNLAMLDTNTGNFDAAIKTLERVIDLSTKHGAEGMRATALNSLAIAHFYRRNLPKAQVVWEEALALYKKLGDEAGVHKVLPNLGNIYYELRQYRKALDAYDVVHPIFKAQADRRRYGMIILNMAGCHDNLGEDDTARALYAEAIEIHRTSGNQSLLATALASLGLLHKGSNELSKAKARLQEAMELAASIGDRPTKTLAQMNLAHVLFEQGDLEAATKHHEEAVAANREMGDDLQLAMNLFGLIDIARARKDFDAALRHSREAVAVITRHVRGWPEEFSMAERERMDALYAAAIQAALAAGDHEAAFDFSENGRALSLVEALGGRSAVHAAVVPEVLAAQEAAARKQEAAALAALREARKARNLVEVRKRRKAWEQARVLVQEVVGRIQQEARAAASVVYPELVTLQRIRTLLGPGEALVAYMVGYPECRALVVTKEDVRHVDLADAATLESTWSETALHDPKKDDGKAVATLRAALIDPLALPGGVKRLLILPQAVLSWVPFALLAPEYEISYAPSATTYALLREQRDAGGTRVLALGDPDYGVAAAAAGRSPAAQRHGALLRLPSSRDEAKAVGDVLLLGKDASETKLVAALASEEPWRAIHMACHGLVDAENPKLSSLALTGDETNDGFLTVSDVLRLSFSTDAAVLSACETARGKLVRAEGVMGLTRAFMYAGAPRVLCSLWKVDDEATSALMVKFYELWAPKGTTLSDRRESKGGITAAQALRQAQAFVRSHAKWKHPYYWAAWVLWGLP